MDGTVLVADDDRTIRTVLTQALTRAGCKVHATSSLTTLMRWVAEGRGDLIITDVAMPDGNGLEMLPKISDDRPDLPVIVISAQNTIMTAIKATEAKAFDYLPKPFDLPGLMKRCAHALAQSTPGRRSSPEADPESNELPLVGQTSMMQSLYQLIAQVMNTDLPVLIWGESGTGKSLIARVIHDFSDRRALPFVVATADDLSVPNGAAQLVARVGGGTLVLDEVGEFPSEIQARLARLMDADMVPKPRFIAISQRDPAQGPPETRLRPDLFYRLSGAMLHVPALRERVEDIPLLAQHFLGKNDHLAKRELSEEAKSILSGHTWPGNVRQLEHAMRQLSLISRAPQVTGAEAEQVIGKEARLSGPASPVFDDSEKLSQSIERHLRRYFDLHGDALPPAGLYQRILHEMEVPLIEISLAATYGNQAKCADLLGINRNTLRKKIKELNIEVTRGRKMM